MSRYRPRSALLRGLRRHHMLHHLRNEGAWLSFSIPAVDALFGTLPARASDVPLTPMARRNAAAGGGGGGGGGGDEE